MGVANNLNVDFSPGAINSWQLCKQLGAAAGGFLNTDITRAIHDINDTLNPDVGNFDVIAVEAFAAIELQAWGVASDTNTATLQLHGWNEGGPGCHMGQITATYGNFTSAASTGFHASNRTHKSIRNAYAAATAYRGCDTYTEDSDYYNAITVFTGEADFPAHCIVSFATSQFKYFSVIASATTGTSVGCIFRPLALKGKNTSPDGLT